MLTRFIEFEKSETWVRGWERPLKNPIIHAVPPTKNTTGDLIGPINGMFVEVTQRLDDGVNGRYAFKHLLHLMASHFQALRLWRRLNKAECVRRSQ